MSPPAREAAPELFRGPESVRLAGETRWLWLCLLFAPLLLGIVQQIFPSLSLSEFVLVIAGGLVFVSVARGRLIGSSIRIEGRQFPELAELVERLAARMGMAAPQIFVRDDQLVPISAVGVGEPYALIISAQYYEMLSKDELGFLVARELAHIAAGHTRLTSLLSASGRENPIVAFVFGAWLRRTEYTADRAGFVLCSDRNAAIGAICVTTFHAIGRRVDTAVLSEQRQEIAADPALRLGEWIAAVPYATNRLDALEAFAVTPLALRWRERFAGRTNALAVMAPVATGVVERSDIAPPPQRIAAAVIDMSVLAAIGRSPVIVDLPKSAPKTATALLKFFVEHAPMINIGADAAGVLLLFLVYSAALVGIGGQTIGMTVFDLRVVRTDFRRPTFIQSAWRYAVAAVLSLSALAIVSSFFKVQPQDTMSKTRVVKARKLT